MRNTGKPSERLFEDAWARLGKRAAVHRFVDAAEIRGRAGVAGQARKAPADYVVTCDGFTEFSDVKSVAQELSSFPFAMIKKGQTSFATKVTAAGGAYAFYVHRLATGAWYRIPWAMVAATKAAGKSSIRFDALKIWEMPD